ncbi:MAG: T9SS type A sorting domain-containing protein [Bacteroidota bacterium]
MKYIKLLFAFTWLASNVGLSQMNIFNDQFLFKPDLNCRDYHSIQQTYDKGYILCRGATDTTGGVRKIYTELVKTNREGRPMWTKRLLKGDTTYLVSVNTIAQSAQGNLVLATSEYNVSHGQEIVLLCMDSIGNTLWSKKYLGEGGKGYVFKVIPTTDNGYFICGSTKNATNVEFPYCFKIDANGNYMWGKKMRRGTDSIAAFYSCIELPGQGYVLAGSSGNKALAVKIDLNGNIIWDRNLFTYSGRFFDVTKVSDGSYIFSGSNADSSLIYNANLSFVRFDVNGNVIWQKGIDPNPGPNFDSYMWQVKAPSNNKFIFSAYVSNPIPATHMGEIDLNGNILWNSQYRSKFHTFNYLPCNFVPATDGGFALNIMAGTIASGQSTFSTELLKLDNNGDNDCEGLSYSLNFKNLNYTPSSGIVTFTCGSASVYNPTLTAVSIKDSILCETILDHAPLSTVGVIEHTENHFLFQNYPNPSDGATNIAYSLAKPANDVFIEVYDSRGSVILKKNLGKQNKGNYSEPFNLNLSAGIYFYSLHVDGLRTSKYMLID